MRVGPERGGKEAAGTPPTFRAGFLEPARKPWDLIWGLDLEAVAFIETADRGLRCVFALIFPTFQELFRLVPQVFGDSAAPSLYTLQGGPHPENPRKDLKSFQSPLLQFQQDWGKG